MTYVSGGIKPELFNSGCGVYCAVLLYDYYIKSFNPMYLVVQINKSNVRSIKLHERLGFIVKNWNTIVNMELNCRQFPNSFAKYILRRISNEEK
jgi:hypothetical protein